MPEDRNPDMVTAWVARDTPVCQYCGGKVTEDFDHDDVFDNANDFYEYWYCKLCMEHSEFYLGDYGEIEVTYTRQEWTDIQAERWQRWWLEQRYGVDNPTHIHDYWQRPIERKNN